jgi:signal transduction histidine kinase
MRQHAHAAWVAIGAAALYAVFSVTLESWRVPTPPSGVMVIARAERVDDAPTGTPPPEHASWTPVALPDLVARPGARRAQAWYRLRAQLEPSRYPLWSLYWQNPRATLAVYVNGALAADLNTTADPLPYYVHDIRVDIPAALLRSGENEFVVHTVRQRATVALRQTWLGSTATLSAYQNHVDALSKHAVRALTAALVVLSLVYGAFWAIRPREQAYAWFAAALAMWALHNAWAQLDVPPTRWVALWRPVMYLALGWFVLFATIFVHRLLSVERPRVERALLMTGVAMSAVLWVLAALHHAWFVPVADYVWVPAVNVLGFYVGWCLLHAVLSRADAQTRIVATVALFLVLVGVRDYLHDRGYVPSSVGRYLPLAAPLVLMSFGGILLLRFARALDESERLNADLGARVAEKSAEIAASYQRIAAMERAQAQRIAREEMLRDMHDGIGGHLVQALAMTERGADGLALHEVVQACLDELRLLIDTSAGDGQGLAEVLVRLRNRLSRRLTMIGLHVEWPMPDTASLPVWQPHRVLQFVRVLQEALANVIKHAGARHVHVQCAVAQAGASHALVLSVRDDGVGFDAASAPGRGLESMRRRATELGGTLEVDGAAGAGTHVQLSVPA